MNSTIIHPASEAEWLELRKQDITSTEIPALFGLADSSYIPTKYELWHRKKKHLESEFEPSDRIIWGTRLQDAIALGIAQDKGWTIRRMSEYMRIEDLRLGSSFDFSIEQTGIGKNEGTMPLGLLEIKNVDSLIFNQKWIINDDGTVEAPPSIELQVQHQLLISGRSFGFIGAMIGGNRVVLIKREADEQIQEAIIRESQAFWKSIDENIEPSPDFERDAETISKLYGYAQPGKVVDMSDDAELAVLAKKHKELGETARKIDKERDAVKAQILIKIGDAEKVIGSEFPSITATVVGPAHVEYDREGYRMFRINWPRTKK